MGHRKLPAPFVRALQQRLDDAHFVVVATRSMATWADVLTLPAVRQFHGPVAPGELISVLPAWSSPWARWNTQGRQITRRDLPKIEVTRYWQAPNFGRPDIHDVFSTRMQYQRQILHGGSMQLTLNISPSHEGRFSVTLEADHLFDRDVQETNPDLLMAVSLASEGLHTCPTLRPARMSREQWEDTQRVQWTAIVGDFAGGDFTSTEILERALGREVENTIPAAQRDVMIERLDMIRTTHPSSVVIGASGLSRYVGFQYADDLVAFENFTYGDALYLMYEDWKVLKERRRRELLAGPPAGLTGSCTPVSGATSSSACSRQRGTTSTQSLRMRPDMTRAPLPVKFVRLPQEGVTEVHDGEKEEAPGQC